MGVGRGVWRRYPVSVGVVGCFVDRLTRASFLQSL